MVSSALATTDSEMNSNIRAETAKVVSELELKAAEMRSKSEIAKTGKLTSASLSCEPGTGAAVPALRGRR